MVKPSLSKLINAGYDRLNAGVRHWPTMSGEGLDRQQFISSSEIGGCARKIKFGKQGEAVPFDNWGFAERGNVIEEWAVAMIRSAIPPQYELRYGGSEQVSFYDGSQSGTPDGLLVTYLDNEYKYYGVEFKSIDPRTNRKYLPRKQNVKQLQQNMDLMERELDVVMSGGLLIYIDASNYQSHLEVFVERDEVVMQELQDRADMIISAKTPEDLPAEGMFVAKGCDYCAYTSQCSAMVTMRKDEAEAIEKQERAMNNVFR